MAVYAQTFATSGFAGAGFKNFVNENEKIKCADNDLDTVRSSYFGGTAFSTKSNMNSVHNVYEARDTGDKKLAITSSKACGFATEGFANSGFKSDKPAAAKSFATLDAGSYRNQNQKNQDGNRNANPSTGLFTQKFAVSGAANKTRSHIHSEFTSCDHSNVDPIDISEQQSTMQYYSEMDTSDDFSAAELPLRYDALTGSYCIDTCMYGSFENAVN
uniref:Uncharacterized protein n=1 Tax=Ditylenchus dipsaci TaxID=166011 RepID=A0A915CYN2_9BILA